MNEPKIDDLKSKAQSQIPGGLAQLRADFIAASTVPQLKAVLAKVFKILMGI